MGDRDWNKQLQTATDNYNKVQKDINKNLRARQQLETQLAENKSVIEELGFLESGAKVFKQTGPVLVPQDLEEAKGNVQKRLDWINSEVNRVEGAVKTLQETLGKYRDVVMKTQKEAGEALSKQKR